MEINKKLPLTLRNIKIQIKRYGFNPVVNDVIALASLIKAENNRFTSWVVHGDDDEYTGEIVREKYFNFRFNEKFISKDISKFNIPVYQPYIRLNQKEIQLTNLYRNYSNRYFDLKSKYTNINLGFLDKSWNIWYDLLEESFKDNYSIKTLNILIAIFIEIKRSISSTLNKNDNVSIEHKYDDIIKYAQIIQDSGIEIFHYDDYDKYPLDLQIALDAITEGIPEFYLSFKSRIQIHNFIPTSQILPKIIESVKNHNLEELNINRIKKFIYVLTKNIDIKLDLKKQFLGNEVVLIHNKLEFLIMIFRHLIGISNKTIKFSTKFKEFKRIYEFVKNDRSIFSICDIDLGDELTDITLFKYYQIIQNNLVDSVKILFYDLFITATHSTDEFFTVNDLILINNLIQHPPKKFDSSRFSQIVQPWFNSELEVPFKFNYLPFDRFDNAPRRFEMSLTHEAYQTYLKALAKSITTTSAPLRIQEV